MATQTVQRPGKVKAVPRNLWEHGGLAVSLALVSGYVDAYSYLSYKLYASFMSGNTTQTGLRAGIGDFTVSAHHLIPISSFMAGVFVGTLLLHSSLKQPLRWLFLMCAVLLGVGLAMARAGGVPGGIEVMFLALSMGALNISVTGIGKQAVHLGYVTGTVNNIAQHLALAVKRQPVPDSQGPWDTYASRAALLIGVWLGFLGGAFFGASLYGNFAAWTLLGPIVLLIALALFDRARGDAT